MKRSSVVGKKHEGTGEKWPKDPKKRFQKKRKTKEGVRKWAR